MKYLKMAHHIELIMRMNNLELSSLTPVVDSDNTRTKSVQLGEKEYFYEMVSHGDEIEVKRRNKNDNGKKVIYVPTKHLKLYTHIMAPVIINHGPHPENNVYPRLSESDPFVRLYLAAPGDLISIIRIVAYNGAGTQKTENLYYVV